MPTASAEQGVLTPETADFYRHAVRILNGAGGRFLVGGAYALAHYTGITRHTKDFDLFVRQEDCERTLELLRSAGCETELTFPHWLGKAYRGDDFCDVIFSSGNGVCRVDEGWFEHAEDVEILGERVKVIPVEEMIWSKGFVVERERYDGADIAHLLRAHAARLDWPRLLERYGPHWRVLFSHLLLFGFVYPGEQGKIPGWVMETLAGHLRDELRQPPADDKLCGGTLLSRTQYLKDIGEWGYRDARLVPEQFMSKRDIRHWTAAAGKDEK